MNKKEIQDSMFELLVNRKQTLIVPNVYLYIGEADLISVSRSNYVTEYEIKRTLADYRRDFRYKRKKHSFMAKPDKVKSAIPNYFCFVFPIALYMQHKDKLNLPDYAGVFVLDGDNVKRIKKAKLLHRLPISNERRNYLGRGLMHRYWSTRATTIT